MSTLPKTTIIITSYNQGQYLEQTILSVLGQQYPNLEYIIMDGGSTDNSVEIIKRYSNRLSHWESGPDKGQAAAIAKGFAMSTGTILGWLNSDDLLLPGCLSIVASKFPREKSTVALAGRIVFIGTDSCPLKVGLPTKRRTWKNMLLWGHGLPQMATFWTREAYLHAGGLDTSLQFAFDYDLFVRLRQAGDIAIVDDYLAGFRLHESQKTFNAREVMRRDHQVIYGKYGLRPLTRTRCIFRRLALPQRTRDAIAWIGDKRKVTEMCNRWREECLAFRGNASEAANAV